MSDKLESVAELQEAKKNITTQMNHAKKMFCS